MEKRPNRLTIILLVILFAVLLAMALIPLAAFRIVSPPAGMP
jgi:hypothetical protein